MTPPIAILGAGPAGLVLARLLELAKIDYIVYERDELANAAIAQGGSLDLHEGSGQLALQEAGLFEQFKAKARYDCPVAFADWTGKVHFKFTAEGGTDRPEIDRKDLRTLLLNSVPEKRIRWKHKVERVERADNGITIHFDDGTSATGYRLVVGADGAWSKARSLVTASKPVYSGLHYLTTNITPNSAIFSKVTELVGGGMYLSVGTGKQISVMKLGDGTYYLAAGLRLPESWQRENAELVKDSESLRQILLKDHFAEWPQLHTDMVKYSDAPFRDWALYHMPVDELSWKTVHGVALIGDAAHVSTPFVGEGANCSMFDSVQLAQQIIKHGIDDLYTAVKEYEKLMFPWAKDLITRSQQSGDLLFAEDAPRGWLQENGILPKEE